MDSSNEMLLQVKNLKKYFPITRGIFGRKVADLKAVDGVSFHLNRGETLGLVGESGCGKTTVGRTIIQLHQATEGEVTLDGVDLVNLKGSDLRHMRRRMQMIFQDPYASLNPRMTVGDIIGAPFKIHNIVNGKSVKEKVVELLDLVGMNSSYLNRYPHEFSGGQRQRIGIARALALNPEFIVCDEPIAALDVSIQAQVINLLQQLQSKFGLSYLFIAHDLRMVRHISNRVAVMYLGKIVELTDRDELYEKPLHPYTKALLSAVPIPDPPFERQRDQILLEGDLPNPANPPNGCNFNTRCPLAFEKCFKQDPEFRKVSESHWVACHLDEINTLVDKYQNNSLKNN